ncbi:hypothetical protein LCGC14_2241430, partial [marine sediment metagenome]
NRPWTGILLTTLIVGSALIWYPWFKFGHHLRVPRELLFVGLGAIGYGAWLAARFRWMGLFVVSASATTMIMAITSKVMYPLAYYQLFSILMGSFIFLMFYETIPKWRKFYIGAIATVVAIQIVMFLFHKFSIDPLRMYCINPLTCTGKVPFTIGTLDNSSLLAGYLAISIPLIIRPYLWLAIPAFALLIYADSTIPVGALAVGLAVVLWSLVSWEKALAGTLIVIILVFAYIYWYHKFNFAITGDLVRFSVWKRALIGSLDRPIIGHGLSAFRQGFTDYATKTGAFLEHTGWARAHSEPIQLAVESGYITVGVVFAYIVSMGRRYWKATKSIRAVTTGAAFATLVVFSFAHFPFHIAPLAAIGLFTMADLQRTLDKDFRGK